MKKPITVITVLIAISTILFYISTAFAEEVIIGTWNLEHFRDGQPRGSPETPCRYQSRDKDSYSRIAEIIKDLDIEILALQEINANEVADEYYYSKELDNLVLELNHQSGRHTGLLKKYSMNRRGGPFPSCGGEMSSTDTLGRLHRVCTRRRSLTGWLCRICIIFPKTVGADLHIRPKVESSHQENRQLSQ